MFSDKNGQRRCVITGLGPITCIGKGVDNFWNGILAEKTGIVPISWTSEQIIDREKTEVRFHHLKAFTKGMFVVWTFKETAAGVLVEIAHGLNFRVRALAPVMEPIIGDFFIGHVANRTLRCMKAHLESRS